MRYIGVDLHTTQLTVCYRDESGNTELNMFPIDLTDEFIASLNVDDQVAMKLQVIVYFCIKITTCNR